MGEGKSRGYVAKLLMFALLCITSASSREPLLEQGTVQEAQELMKRVDTLFSDGQYSAAIPLAERAMAIREHRLGSEHPDTATSINMLGRVLRYAGKYPRAEQLLKRALAIREKVFGPEHPATADSLNNLAAVYHMVNDYAQAESLYKRALAIREKALGSEHPDTLISMNNLALLYKAIGNYPDAESLFKRTLVITERVLGEKHPDTAKSILHLGGFYMNVELLEQAEPLLKRALHIDKEILGPDHPDTAVSLRALAKHYDWTGRFNESELLYRRALGIFEKTLGLEHPYTVGAMTGLGLVYVHTGAYELAESLFLRGLAINEKVLGPNTYDTSLILANLARLYMRIGAYDRAEPLLKRSLAIRKQAFGLYSLPTSSSLFDLAGFYVAVGNYAEAESLHLQALAIKEKVLGPRHSSVADSFQDLANLYVHTGDTRAESALYQALDIREKSLVPEHPDTVSTLNALAMFEWGHQKKDLALQLFQRAQALQANNSSKFLLSGSESRKQAYLQTQEKDTYKHVSFSLAVPGGKSAALGLTSVLQYKGRVLDAMSDSMSYLRRHANQADEVLLRRRAELAGRLSILTYQAADILSTNDYQKDVDDLRAEQETVERELAERSSEFRRQVVPVTVAAVQRAIPGDAALVEWFRYEPVDPKKQDRKVDQSRASNTARYVAYVLKRDAEPIAIDIGEASRIEVLVHDFRLAVSDSKQDDVKEKLAVLSKTLLMPLRGYLKDVEHLLISPDGALNLVPMAALIDDQNEYLAQRFAITYLTSGRDLLRFESKLKVGTEAVVVANPTFGQYANWLAANATAPSQRSADLDRSGLIFRPLINTAFEAQDLQKLLKLKTSDVLLGGEATEAKLKQVHSPRILHIASHGFFLSDQELTAEFKKRSAQGAPAPPLSENPLLRSGIALAGANSRHSGASDDGIFTALEAAQLDLQGTELVVLSACDTGVGEVQNGEGVYGLRRALVLAGAQTQVTSLWKVSDEATRLLMVDYYHRLLKGEGRSAALRRAQQAMLANPEFSHPYYWASFVPIGNWTPLPKLH